MLFLHHIDETNQVDGNLLTIFDYYSFYKSKGESCEIIFFIPSTSFVDLNHIDIVTERYKNEISYSCVDEHNIYNLLKLPYSNCFLSDRTYYEITNKWKKEICLSKFRCYVYRTWFSFKYSFNTKNATILNEVQELGETNYKRKIYFEGIKNYKCKNKTALVLANGQRYLTEYEIDEILEIYKDYKIQIIANYPIENKHPRLQVYDTVKEDLFNFSTYIYTANDYDYAPRMLLESIFLEKEVLVYKTPSLSNSERLNVLSNKNLLKNYMFTLDDIIPENQIEEYKYEFYEIQRE